MKIQPKMFAPALFVMAFGVLAIASAACDGGIKFNGDTGDTQINPRSTPINHFPLPVETFDIQSQQYYLDGAVIAGGRPAKVTAPGQPGWAMPATPPLPTDPSAFAIKASTDVWFAHGDRMAGDMDDRDDGAGMGPNMMPDEVDIWGGSATRAGSMSYACQWLVQQVNGQPRTDGPINYDNVNFESIAISIADGEGAGVPIQARIDPGVGPLPLPNPNPGFTIGTSNSHWVNPAINMPAPNEVEYAIAVAPAAPPVLFTKWMEVDRENLFIEMLTDSVSEAPSAAYFAADGHLSGNGGVYINRIVQNEYYTGVILGHTIGCGVGVPETAFVRPGISNGEEDIMNVNVEIDQLFFITSGRRFQFTAEALIRMQNTPSYPLPLNSPQRLAAEAVSTASWFDRRGLRLKETCPGPLR